jgi:hypothetical protein
VSLRLVDVTGEKYSVDRVKVMSPGAVVCCAGYALIYCERKI